jgi:hypothetical protein
MDDADTLNLMESLLKVRNQLIERRRARTRRAGSSCRDGARDAAGYTS